MADGCAPLNVFTSSPAASPDGIDVIYFAGVGGSSEAYELALLKSPDVALNHKSVAIGVHMANHPTTEHLIADVFDIDPTCVRPGVKWRSFWASPDCRHFSKAKGSAPVSERVRGLCWIVIKVAKLLGDLAPDVIFIENVEEFVDYGPLLPPDDQGRQYPDPAQKGRCFRTFEKRLRQCGYAVEWTTEWVMAEYGVATTRKRLLMIARRDGRPIVWPAATHAPRKKAVAKSLKPFNPVSDHIDFSLPCPSIFLTQAECKARGINARRPLKPATMARIAKGVERYVIRSAEPFIVPVTHQGGDRTYSIQDPLRTVTSAQRGEFALIQPEFMGGAIVGCGSRAGQSPPRGLDEPLGTIISKADRCLVAAHMVGTAYGDGRERAGVRAWPVDEPCRTITGSNDRAVIAASMIRTDMRKSNASCVYDIDDPLRTITSRGGHGISVAYMEQANTGMVGRSLEDPLSTIVNKGCTQRLVAAHLDYPYGSNLSASAGDPREPMKTATATGNHHFLVQHELAMAYAPHGEEMRAFLTTYYGPSVGQEMGDPLNCITTRMRYGLVVVAGELMQITDIGMRMLTPPELAGAQGFSKGYRTGWNALTNKRLTLTEEVAGIGNSVSPKGAAPFIAANLGTAEDMARLAA